MEEEEERKGQDDEPTAEDVSSPEEALIDWLELDRFAQIPAVVTVHTHGDSEIEGLHETIQIFNYAARITEHELFREMDISQELVAGAGQFLQTPLATVAARFVVHDVRQGSIIIEGSILFGLGAVLKVVLGKPANEAWKSSKTRKRLVKAVRQAIDKAGDKFAELLVAVAREREVVRSIEVEVPKKPRPRIEAQVHLKPKRKPKKKTPA
jgi:hypothetical protein